MAAAPWQPPQPGETGVAVSALATNETNTLLVCCDSRGMLVPDPRHP
jgi:hypothetical protein